MTEHQDALLLLAAFQRRALPALLRRLKVWRGFDALRHRDVIEDLIGPDILIYMTTMFIKEPGTEAITS